MTTMVEVWGFAFIEAATLDGSDLVGAFTRELAKQCRERGVKDHVPSDALDMSRDLILTDAAHALGSQWSLVGDTLYLWPLGHMFQSIWSDLEVPGCAPRVRTTEMSDTFYLGHKMTRKRLPVGAYTVTCTCEQLPTLAMYDSLYANLVEHAHLAEIKAQYDKGSE